MEKKTKTLAQRIDSDKAPLQPLSLANLSARKEASAPPWPQDQDAHQRPPVRGPPQVRLLRKPEVLARLGIKKTQLDDAIRDGRFPAPTKILEGGRAEGWFSDEVDGYLEARRSARDQGRAA